MFTSGYASLIFSIMKIHYFHHKNNNVSGHAETERREGGKEEGRER